jgi:hypothetical protein
MEIIYGTTHLIMIVCVFIILYPVLKPHESVDNMEKQPMKAPFYAWALRMAEVTAITAYRIAGNILITYLK